MENELFRFAPLGDEEETRECTLMHLFKNGRTHNEIAYIDSSFRR